DGIRDFHVTGVQTCALPISRCRPDFETPEHVGRAGIEAIEQGFTRYTATAGTPELRAAIAEKHQRENNLRYDPATEIIATVGAKIGRASCRARVETTAL